MASSTPVTVTVWGADQSAAVKVSGPETVTTVRLALCGVTVTLPLDSKVSTTV